MGGLLLRDPPGFGPMSNVRWMARRAAGIIMVTSPSPRAVPPGSSCGFNDLDAHDPRLDIDNPDGRLNSGRSARVGQPSLSDRNSRESVLIESLIRRVHEHHEDAGQPFV